MKTLLLLSEYGESAEAYYVYAYNEIWILLTIITIVLYVPLSFFNYFVN